MKNQEQTRKPVRWYFSRIPTLKIAFPSHPRHPGIVLVDLPLHGYESFMTTKLLLGLLLATVANSIAEPRYARIFTDHAVLQRDANVLVWGFDADPKVPLQLRFGAITANAGIEPDGSWTAELPPMPASQTGRNLELLQGETVVAALRDILVGDVWLGAGQSNMQFVVRGMLKGLPEAQRWADSATKPTIRIRRIDAPVLESRTRESRDLPKADPWMAMTPESVPNFSAVLAVFARQLNDELAVPIGIIDTSWGGKPIEPFIPREAFESPLLSPIRDLADRDQLDELAKHRGGVIIRNPEGHPGAIFNARIRPVIPYALKGFLWYQAESNAGKGEDPRNYRHKMEALASGWRNRWAHPDLPFYFVQLPSYPNATGWIRVREEQRRSLSIPHSGMAVTIDIRGEGIHPPNKVAVGERLAALALADINDTPSGTGSGPIYAGHHIVGWEVRVRFREVGQALFIGDKPGFGPPEKTPDEPLRWFELAGADGVWKPAEARIEGNEVVVLCHEIPLPVAVRYACTTEPQGGNLYNAAGLPASPFCSDLELLPWQDHQ